MTLQQVKTAIPQRLVRNSDIFLAVAVVAIIVMMIIPLPPIVLDVLLTFNIAFALLILLVGMYTLQPLQFSIFPSLLLMVTLFRLSLNVSGTRLVLLHAYAGEVIQSFGRFVVGGNYIVGFIIFLILIIIQFIVITNGAGRVAEVAARFTLDAMPGKQMAIDADLNAGLINEEEARMRRKQIEQQADFYGAMDGASKFIRGDAVAAIVILIINILGGFFIGMVQKGMNIMDALKTYTLLTVGEGLVTQLPALLISTATGIIITRAASEANLGEDVTTQVLGNPRAIYIVAGLLMFFFMIPGLPKIPFLLMAIGAYFLGNTIRTALVQPPPPRMEEEKGPENVVPLLDLDPMELEIGYGLIPLVDTDQGGDLLERITMVRRNCATELGLVVPPIRVRDNMQLRPSQYAIKIYGLEVAKGEVMVGRFLAINPGTVEEPVEGIQTREPAFGLPALWLPESEKERAEMAGYTVIDPSAVVATHVTEVIKGQAAQLLGRQEVQLLLDNVKKTHPVVVDELIPAVLTLGELQKVLQNLLRERLSIRNLLLILETLADQARATKEMDALTEGVRQALGKAICQEYQQPDGSIPVITLEPSLEKLIVDAVRGERDAFTTLDPETIQKIYGSLLKEVEKITKAGYHPIVLCSTSVRPYFKRLTERVIPHLVVLSYNEIVPEATVEAFGMVSLTGEVMPL
ncbi:MAG: flagellar biosynthesis protein FlhA [Armatimonadetes bacterium]|nr:flagellar biosynthesis protein FlhA [Armatimonadota bacterium]